MSKRLLPRQKVSILKDGVAQINDGAQPEDTWTALGIKHQVSKSSLYEWLKAVRKSPVEDWEAILTPELGKRRGKYKEVTSEAYQHFKKLCASGVPWAQAHRITADIAAKEGWIFPGIRAMSARLRRDGMKPPTIYDNLEV